MYIAGIDLRFFLLCSISIIFIKLAPIRYLIHLTYSQLQQSVILAFDHGLRQVSEQYTQDGIVLSMSRYRSGMPPCLFINLINSFSVDISSSEMLVFAIRIESILFDIPLGNAKDSRLFQD